MLCPICAESELIHDTRDMPHIYKGETTVIPNVTGDFCPACGEAILDFAEASRVSGLMREFREQVNASFVDPKFITAVREKLDLDEKRANEIFGGGHNAFSRYERGSTRPPLSLVLLFRLLDRHPDLLTEIVQQ
jgi:HTH-type transcriptional regulator / antitoxin MqsA